MTNTVDLIDTLHLHYTRFSGLLFLLEVDPAAFSISMSLSYKNMVFKLKQAETLYVQAAYEYDEKTAALVNFYSPDPKAEVLLAPYLEKLFPQSGEYFIAPLNYEPLSDQVHLYLTIAESVARQAYLCASGDDYSPGYFSTVTLNADGILLEQINHKNSRSLAHKQDYSLRDLTFFIPYGSHKPDRLYNEEYIGRMRILFSDRSSANNKDCGNKIREQINAERMKFDSEM